METTTADKNNMKPNLEDGKAYDAESNEDILAKTIGELGRWQIFIMVIIAIPVKLSVMWNMIGIIFLAPKTTFKCISRENTTGDISVSTCYQDCDSYEYFTEYGDSIITQFDLICERAWLAQLTQTLFLLGMLVGSMLFGFMADRYGRRKALLPSCMIQLILSLVLPLSPEYWSFTIIRFFIGASTLGIGVTAYIIVLEITGPSKRELISCVFHLPYAVGQMSMAAIAYYSRSWKIFALGIATPTLLFPVYVFLVPESPRWLITMGRLEEASEVMKKAAKRNKLPTSQTLEVAKAMAEESRSSGKQQTKVSYIDLITNSTLRVRSLCCFISWFILGLSFFGSNQYIGQTSPNVFLSMVLAGGLQIPGILSSGYLYKRFGRRKTVVGLLLVTSVCNGLLALPDEWFYLKLVSGAVGISCISGAFTAIYVFTSELFPTVARNMAIGVSSTGSRLGSMLAPFVASMAIGWPPVVFASAPLLAVGACCCLPETKGMKLEDRIAN